MKLSAAQTFMASLPGVWSKPHGDGTSYLVGKRRFVSLLPDGKQLIVGVPLETAKEAVAENPDAFEEHWWGRMYHGLRITLVHAHPQAVHDLIDEAWRMRAPKRVVAAYDASKP